MSKVTVLMAVYNAAGYLRESLGSLLRQTLTDIQVVCVDDASTDSSLQILEGYAAKDRRVKVMHLTENHGQAYARNRALTIADGEFITMLDADDWLAADALEQAVAVFEAHPLTDCVLMDLKLTDRPGGDAEDYDWHYPEGKTRRHDDGSFEVMSGHDAFMASLDWGIHGVTMDRAWLYRKYPYDDSCRFYSDDNTARIHFLASREVRCCKGRYYYRQVAGSVSHHVGVGRMDWMRAADSMRRQLRAMDMGDEVLDIWEWERWKVIVGCYWFFFVHRRQFSASDRRYCMGEIRKAWQGVDARRLKGRPVWKPGWCPLPGHWLLFRLEETVYFSLRRLAGKW